MTSADLAVLLRSGPVRSTLDKISYAVAKALDIDFVCLGIRYDDKYAVISSYGLPLTAYTDQVPANRLSAKLFDREVEVADLSKEPNFTILRIIPEAKHWRYGINSPVRLNVSPTDGGVLALSGASRETFQPGGARLSELRRFADIIADVVWITVQVGSLNSRSHRVETVARVLTGSVRNSPFPAAIVDPELTIVGFSKVFSSEQFRRTGTLPKIGDPLAMNWLDEYAVAALQESMKTGRPSLGRVVSLADREKPYFIDFYRLAYVEVPAAFGIIVFRDDIETTPGLRDVAFDDRAPDPPVAAGDGATPVSSFLFRTLITRHRLLTRRSQSYLVVRAWRKPLKTFQLDALKALKELLPDAFVDQVAREIADAVCAIHGTVSHCVVVPVPCGHSGPGCLSARLAEAVAAILGLHVVNAFAPIEVKGSSHPKTNVRRPRLKLVTPIDQSVILVDDVAASGAHIEEAARLLSASPAVWPVVWVAD